MPAGGGLLQLVAQGIQDIYLTGNPQMTFFKFVYKRCTNFAIESMPMYFDGTANFGQKISCLIPRKGDLLGRVYIDVLLPRLTLNDLSDTPVSYVNSIGNALIQEVSLEIGEQQIDKQTGEWMQIWEQFITPAGQRDALNNMIGQVDGYAVPDFIPGTSSPGIRLYIPLQFFFCRNPGLYLPLLAMQYHPIRINVTISPLQSLFYTTELLTNPNCSLTVNPVNITSMQLWGDYVYLDTDERRRFVSKSQEYLIEQVQYTSLQAVTATQQQVNIETDFNHPIKEFFFVARRDKMNQTHEYFNYSSLATYETLPAGLIPFFTPSQVRTDLIATAKLQLDGYDRFQDRDAPYFRLVQPYEHHTFTPVERYIYCYSLALNPEQIQPSGSLNASRIDSVNWQIVMNPLLSVPEGTVDSVSRGPCTIRIYAVNYNVLRVVGGYAGVLFTI
jgi:hypothetical protein